MPAGDDKNTKHPLLGIDLGTTYSKIARWDGREPEVYQNAVGDPTTQSVVYRDPKPDSKTGEHEILVGNLAYKRGLIDPDSANMLIGVKRHMDRGSEPLRLGDTTYTPIQISAMILKKVYGDVAQKVPGFKARGTVVTVPYHFKMHQQENTRRAAEEAGIECNGLIQEPIAASLAYAWDLAMNRRECHETILVFDLGGGTFDLTLFKLDLMPGELRFEVLATGGDDRLGGMDFDEAVMALIVSKSGIDLSGASKLDRGKAEQKLRFAANEAKEALASANEWSIIIPDVTPGVHVQTSISVAEFEEAIRGYLDRIDKIVQDIWTQWTETCKAEGETPPERSAVNVDRVIRVGGSSKAHCIETMLIRLFGADKIWQVSDPRTAIAEGAAMYAAFLDDPAAFDRKISVITRTGHAFGVRTADGGFAALIRQNRRTPCAVRQLFRLAADGMSELQVEVYQGSDNATKADQNTKIGTVVIDMTPPPPQGTPVKVTFSVSKEQTLSVSVDVEGRVKDAVIAYAGTDAAS